MRSRLAAGSCAIVVAAAAAAWWTTSGSALPPAPTAPARTPHDAANSDRTYLSQMQVADAIRNGTFDRPVKSLLRVPKRLSYGDFMWSDSNVPAGPTWIRVDLHSQLISIFRAGNEIGTAVIVYGGDNKQTPTGKLHILAKAKQHRSSLYDAEMPYTLRLTGDGVSIHGSAVRYGAASHGCIGVPIAFARRLFEAAHVGDDVVIIPASRRS